MDTRHRRVEDVERAAYTDLAVAAAGLVPLNLRYELADDALILIAPGDPHFLINRVIGLGVAAPARREAVARFVRDYRGAGIDRYFVHITEDARPAELRAWLAKEGLVRQRRWMKFVHGGDPVPEPRCDLEVRRVDGTHGEAFGRIVAAGFDMGDASVPALGRLTERSKWQVFMAFAGGEPAATGALFVDGGVGWCDFGVTAPPFRRRGAQRALLAARIGAARDLGCDVIATETGEAVPGDPQHSYHNIMWAGFRELGLRDNYAPG
ncbi:MAG: GNAT family N-acetyltransferase [Alphaproteobacteria bacterium]